MVERVMTLSRGWSLSAKGIGKALETIIIDGLQHLSQLDGFGEIGTSSQQQQTTLFCAELEVSRQVWTDSGMASVESALDRFTDGVTRTYWRHPGSPESKLAVGSVMAVESHGTDRWESLRQHWENQQQGISQVMRARGELALSETKDEMFLHRECFESRGTTDIPWYGGGGFFDDTPGGPWAGWPAAVLYVPEFELVEDETAVCLRVRMMLPQVNNERHQVSEVLRRFFKWFSETETDDWFSETETDVRVTGVSAEPQDLGVVNRDDGADIGIEAWYQDAVSEAASEIRSGAYHKLVLARPRSVSASRRYQPGHVVRELTLHYPDSFVFATCWGSSCFVGASPERLVRVENHVANVDCLAGTTARGASEAEDASLADALLHSAKDRKEHKVVLDWIEHRLSNFSSEITHKDEPQIRKLANVQHLHTPMVAWLKPGVTILNLMAELHPTPAVAGTPREIAISLIREREPIDRGWYAGCLGIVQGNGDGEMCVAIRSALLTGTKAILYAGAGIMGDSNPTSEWRETELKLRPMEDALAASAHFGGNTSSEEELD